MAEVKVPPFSVIEITEKSGRVERWLSVPSEHHWSSMQGIRLDGDGTGEKDKIVSANLNTYEYDGKKVRVIPDVEVRVMIKNGKCIFRVLEPVPKTTQPLAI
jgi:hypothetical protein